MRSKTYYAITWVVGILGFIGGIISGVTVGLVAMLYIWIVTAIFCLIFGGITAILRSIEELSADQENISMQMEDVTVNVQKTSEPVEKGDWICPKCGKINKKYVGSCGCGYSKSQNDLWECPKCHIFTPYNNDNECMNCHWKA